MENQQFSITVSANSPTTLAAALESWAKRLGGSPEEKPVAQVAAQQTAKKAKAAAKIEAETEEEENFSLDSEDAPEAVEAEEEKEITLKDVIGACKTYAQDNGREKVAAILKKYKVTSVQDLKKTDYAKVYATLTA